MFTTYLSFLILVLFFVLFGWLTVKAWQARRAAVRIVGVMLAGLITLLSALIIGLSIRGFVISQTPRNFPIADLQVQGTPEQIAHGEKMVTFLCAACHSATGELPLTGGRNLADDIGLPLGDIFGPNLTPAGDLSNWTDGEILRAIREGTHKTNRPMAMPVQNLKNLSDIDVQAIIAYLRSQPAVSNQVPPLRPTLLSEIMIGAGLFDFSAKPISGPVIAPPSEGSQEYGEYLINISDCRDCHGPDLSGGKPPSPPGPNLRAVAGWTPDDFIRAMRTGIKPDGAELKAPMPWKQIGAMDDTWLQAIYQYLKGLPPAAQ